MDIGCVNGCPEAECDCNYIAGLENKIKGLKSENKKLKLEIKKLEQSLKDSSALLEAKAKQFEEAKGRALERQEPTLEELQKEKADRLRAKIEQIKDESYYKENAELLKDDAWTAITTEAAKHIFAEGSWIEDD